MAMHMKLPRAPTTFAERFKTLTAGEVPHELARLPPTFSHSGEVGLFSDATVPLVKPGRLDQHPMMPETSRVPEHKMPMPSIPKNLMKGLHAPATKPCFGEQRVELHSKKNVPIVFRG